MNLSYLSLIKELNKLSNPQRAKVSAGFFKIGKGEYGEGDIFLGITVPEQRNVALKFVDLSLSEILKLLNSKIHEHRFTALEILVLKYENLKKSLQKFQRKDLGENFKKNGEIKKIVDFYLKNLKFVNNWDLVDGSAYHILGDYLFGQKQKYREVLYRLARSKNLWERRVAIVSTFAFIRGGDFKDCLKISEILVKDREDLIQKACGWMLREVGKKDVNILKNFLNKYGQKIGRTMLRYAIEKFSKEDRAIYLNKNNI